jgi:hypothetical protein
MKALTLIAIALALTAAGCHREQSAAGGASAGKGGTSMQTPRGGATGQASEGSTDKSNAPARPSSPTSK